MKEKIVLVMDPRADKALARIFDDFDRVFLKAKSEAKYRPTDKVRFFRPRKAADAMGNPI